MHTSAQTLPPTAKGLVPRLHFNINQQFAENLTKFVSITHTRIVEVTDAKL